MGIGRRDGKIDKGNPLYASVQRLAERQNRKAIAEAKALEPPDLTDEMIRGTAAAQSRRLGVGRTLGASFSGGRSTLLGGR